MNQINGNQSNNQEIPEDYYTGNWVTVVNKKKVKREKRLARRNKEDKEDQLRALKEKKIEERKNAPLWYEKDSWQHKVLTDQYVMEDGVSLKDKYELDQLIDLYKNAKNNYRINGVCYRLMKVINIDEWDKIKDKVTIK